MLAKSGLLSERERLPTRSLVFVLLPQGYQEQKGTFRLEEGPGQPTQQVWFQEICLWKQKPAAWWDHHPGLMALYPLCDQKRDSAGAVTHAAAAIRHREMDSLRRAELLTTLGIFGRLVDKGLDVLSIIRREEMHESSFAQELVQEGEVARARKDILRVLTIRFGEERTKDLNAVLGRIGHLDQLDALMDLAAKARRLSQFRKALPAE